MLERMKPIVFFLLVGAVAGYFVYKETTRVGRPGIINVGEQAPDFSIKGQDGREIKLSDYRGKIVFLNFWATWCPPCVKEMPDMQALNDRFKDRPFQMLAISVDNDWEDVEEFYKEHNLSIPAFFDPGRQVAYDLYKVSKYPETFLINANGYVIKHTLVENWADPRVIASLETLIRENEEKQRVSSN